MNDLIRQNIFLIMALLSSCLASISSGIIGTYVVIKRISFLAGSLSHAILGGMGLFLYLERTFHLPFLTPLSGAITTSLMCAIIMGYGRYKFKEREDTLISILWSLGMSLGIIFLSATPGPNVDILNYLFGNLLWTGFKDIILLISLLGLVIYFHLKHHMELVALSFDEKQAELSGINCKKLFIKLLILVGIVIVFLIKTVGAILVMSMLTIPAATACHYAKNVKSIVNQSVLLGLIYAIFGVIFAYILNWPPGATITLLASLGYSFVKLGGLKKIKANGSFSK
jgi:zinc transport system permease protein